MPAPIMTVNSTVMCSHGGQAQLVTPVPRVLLSGQPAVAMTTAVVVAGCPFNTGTNPAPCLTGQFMTGALRVLLGGQPALLQSSTGLAMGGPAPVPLQLILTQTRVVAS